MANELITDLGDRIALLLFKLDPGILEPKWVGLRDGRFRYWGSSTARRLKNRLKDIPRYKYASRHRQLPAGAYQVDRSKLSFDDRVHDSSPPLRGEPYCLLSRLNPLQCYKERGKCQRELFRPPMEAGPNRTGMKVIIE